MKKKEHIKVLPKEVRKARAYLRGLGFTTAMMPPRVFVATAKRTGKSFAELMKQIARLKLGGQGEGQSPEAVRLAENEV